MSAVASATPATAAPAGPSYVDFSQCANGSSPSTSSGCPADFTGSGSLTPTNSHYAEDDVVPQRAVVALSSGAALTGHSFTLRYQARKGTIHTYDSLATWNLTQSTADRCQGLAAASCPAAGPSTKAIPDDPGVLTPFISASGATATHMIPAGAGRQMTLYGGTITDVSVPVHSCATPCTGDDFATITVTYSIAAAPATVMLLYGGHLASGVGPRGWGPGLGAANVNGGPYHFKWDSADGGSVGNRDNQISGVAIRVIPVVDARVPGPAPTATIVGTTLTDGATLTGGNAPTGSIVFRLYAPTDTSCSGTPIYSETVAVLGNAVYRTTAGFAANAVGTWHWTASYSGDALNAAVATACIDGPVAVAQAVPMLATTPVPLSGLVGVGLTDAATLSRGYNPGGTISFRLYGPADPSCVLTPAFAETVTVTGNGSYGPTALAVPATAAGMWQWAATYSGDSNNAAATNGCDKEQIAIAKRAPVLATAADPTTTVYGTTLGAAATLSGTYAGTGGIVFSAFAPADTGCASARYSTTVTVSGDGRYHTATPFTPTSVGTWHWSATYSGDANNGSATRGCDPASAAVVTPAPLTVTADDAYSVYRAPFPAFRVHYGPFVLGEGPSVLGGALTFATSTTPTSTVGDYSVTPGGLNGSNYAITYVAGTLHLYTGLARCWVPGTAGLALTALPGARVELLSGATVVATTTADANAGYRFYPLGVGATFSARYFGTITTPGGPRNVSCGTVFVADASGNAAAPDAPQVQSLQNHTWPAAFLLQSGVAIQDYLFREGQSTWYRIAVAPGQRLVVSLRDLPQDYSLVVYRDIRQIGAALGLTSINDLRQIAAQIAPAELSPAELSPTELSPAELSPAELSPDAYSLAQSQALYAISAHAGTSPELVVRNTWNNTGSFYIRVVGHNGAYDPARPFTLSARTASLSCTGSSLTKSAPVTLNTAAAAPRTIVLTDTARLRHADGTRLDRAAVAAMLNSLTTLAARPEVGGLVLDLAGDAGLDADYAQWDANRSCPEAANIVAEAIHDLVGRFRSASLEYIVLAGGNDPIPYRLSRDVAGLGSETMYRPPVLDASPSEAALRLGYVQSQDYYGSSRTIIRFGQELYVPEAAVGRLVETAEDITAAIGAYIATPGGASRPASGLVTGYDFLADVAADVTQQLRGSGLAVDADLIEATGLGPLHASAWTADQLRAKLFSRPFDILALNAHFSANRLLAADYTTRIGSEEIDALPLSLLSNALVLSTGCHSGYNIVDPDAVPVATQPRDFPQVLVSRGNTLVGSTGYAYGDSQFIKYTEALVSGIVRELRYGTGPVAIGKAVANAKRTYLRSLNDVGGIDAKALAQLTLYGLPMRGFDLPAGRLVPPSPPSPGNATPVRPGLSSLDVVPTYGLARHDLVLPIASGGTDTVSYYDADGEVVTTPGQPVLPRTTVTLDLPDRVARGAVLVSGNYVDVPGFRPLVDVANTEVRGQHPPYATAGFAPLRTFGVNSLVGQTLVVTPFQYASGVAAGGAALSGTARIYPSGGSVVRVYYSTLIGSAGLADAPTIYRTVLTETATGVHVDVTAGALSAVDIADLFVTYTLPGSGTWSALSVSGGGLVAGPSASTGSGFARHFTGDIATATPRTLRAFIQAVGGNGMVSSDTNGGLYYRVETPTATAQNPKATTALALTAAAGAAYRVPITVGAVLTANGQPLGGKLVSFSLGNSVVRATTAADGGASVKLPVNVIPSAFPYEVAVSFAEDDAFLSASARGDLVVSQSAAALVAVSVGGGQVAVDYSDSVVLATLTAGNASIPLNEEPVIVDLGSGRMLGVLTDGFGRVTISTLDFGGLAPGAYPATIRYAGDIRFSAATVTVTLTVRPEKATLTIPTTGQASAPINLFTVVQQPDGSRGDLTKASVAYTIAGAGGSIAQGTFGVNADGTAATGVSLAQGVYRVTESAGGYFTSPVTTGPLYVSCIGTGKVTGVGWVPAAGGGHSNLGMTVQEGAGDSTPSGNLEVQFASPAGNFRATAFDAFAVCGTQFALRGSGTVNGVAGYLFAVIGSDASAGDLIEVRVWGPSGSLTAPDYLIALQALQGGNITVH